jgi:Zn-dependent M28 family amino/carboxypeptidase
MYLLHKRQSIIFVSFFILQLVLILAITGCSRKPTLPPVVDADMAFKLVRQLVAYGSRPSGSEAARKQAEFLKRKATEFGAVCKIQKFTGTTPDGVIQFRNVIAQLPGDSKDFIIIGCHYDTKKMLSTDNFAGANDGASGAGLLLALIKAVAAHKPLPPYSLRFIFFDGEECINNYSETDGLHGSRYYAEQLDKTGQSGNCRAVIIADMIGDKDLQVEIPADSDAQLKTLLLNSAEKLKYQASFMTSQRTIIDDHTPFQKIGLPAIDIIDFNYGPGNSWWHTTEDTLDKLDKQSFKIVGDVILEMIWRMPEK